MEGFLPVVQKKTLVVVVVAVVVFVVVVVVIGKYLLERVHCGGLPSHCAEKLLLLLVWLLL